MIKHAKSADHLIHTIKVQGDGRKEFIPGTHNADVCLNCTKKRCFGTKACMQRRKAGV